MVPAPTQTTNVHVIASTTRGPNLFENRNPGLLTDHVDNRNIRGYVSVRIPARDGDWYNGYLCWRDDTIDSGNGSDVRVQIVNGSGYTVSPTRGHVNITIAENDFCNNPPVDGVVHKLNASGGAWGTCTCAMESQHPSVRRALDPDKRKIPTPGPDGRYGTDDDGTTNAPEPSTGFLRSLAAQFHDPSYLYCEESPYKGLPN